MRSQVIMCNLCNFRLAALMAHFPCIILSQVRNLTELSRDFCFSPLKVMMNKVLNVKFCLLYPPQTLFVGGILFSRCPSVRPCVRASVRPSVRP